jgi:hypothetical protein
MEIPPALLAAFAPMEIPPALLAAFPPSADLLLDVTRQQVDDAMLTEIAAADYGMHRAEHLAVLRPIRDHGIVPALMQWYGGEVLELIRWSDPENPAHKPGSQGLRGHQMRAFACAALLRAATIDDQNDNSQHCTLAQCLVSAKVLGEEMSSAAARFLTWRIPRVAEPEVRWLFAFGLLVVAVRLRSGRFTDRVLGDAADWVLAEEAKRLRPHYLSEPAPINYSSKGAFQRLAVELIREAETIHTDDVRDILGFIGGFVMAPG